MRDLLAWLASVPADARDAALEERLGIEKGATASLPPGDSLIGYHASGVGPIVQALLEVPVASDDILVDLGSGLGKVVLLAHLLTGATARGIELQPALVDRARASAGRLGIDVHFTQADARDAPLEDGTVFYLYAPFTGAVLTDVLHRLHSVAKDHSIVVCALGIDIPRNASVSWLRPRPVDSFWLSVYDSAVPGVPPRPPRASTLDPHLADTIARGR